MASTPGFGQMEPTDTSSEFNRISFLVEQILGRMRTCAIVKVVGAGPSGTVGAATTIAVQPMVNMIDGQGNSQAHGTIHYVPYARLQGGTNAIINDPQV